MANSPTPTGAPTTPRNEAAERLRESLRAGRGWPDEHLRDLDAALEAARAEGRREADEWWATRFAAGYKSDGSGMRPYMDMTIRAEDYFDQHVEGGWPLPRIDRNDPRLVARHGRSSDPEPEPDAATIHREFESLADSFDVMAGQTGQRAWADAATAMRDKWRSLWAVPALQATQNPKHPNHVRMNVKRLNCAECEAALQADIAEGVRMARLRVEGYPLNDAEGKPICHCGKGRPAHWSTCGGVVCATTGKTLREAEAALQATDPTEADDD